MRRTTLVPNPGPSRLYSRDDAKRPQRQRTCLTADCGDPPLRSGNILDGAGNPRAIRDIEIAGERISFVGHAASPAMAARDPVDAPELVATLHRIDAHSHRELEKDCGHDALPFL